MLNKYLVMLNKYYDDFENPIKINKILVNLTMKKQRKIINKAFKMRKGKQPIQKSLTSHEHYINI